MNRVRKTPLKREKDKAWKAFSLYIRTDAIRNGLVECYTCGVKKDVKQMQAGHGIGGRNNAVLFLEEVVRPQCAGCNVFGRGQYKIFTRKLIDELGLDRYDELVTISNQTLKYSVQDFIDIQDKYNKLLSEI